MNHSPTFRLWQARLQLFSRRAATWLRNYFLLNGPLNWPPTVWYASPGYGWRGQGQQPMGRGAATGFAPGGNRRTGISHFYLGILAGSFATYFVLGGAFRAGSTNPAADFESLAGIALALALYPAAHRLGRFDDLHTISGSMLVAGMFGFIIPILVRVLGG